MSGVMKVDVSAACQNCLCVSPQFTNRRFGEWYAQKGLEGRVVAIVGAELSCNVTERRDHYRCHGAQFIAGDHLL